MDKFISVYHALTEENVESIREIYSSDVHFIDPAHEIRGIEPLLDYFRNLYANVIDIGFDCHHPITDGSDAYLQWNMRLSHPRIRGGSEIVLPGSSFLRFNDDSRVYHHRDYFDLGAMLYEHLPVLGPGVRYIKKRLGS